MELLEQLRHQLASLRSLQQLVKTMKALSAANIRQYEQSVDSLTGYYEAVERGLQVVLADYNTSKAIEAVHNNPKPFVAIVFGSDYGLCGRFNDDIANFSEQAINAAEADPAKRYVLVVGERLATSFKRKGHSVDDVLTGPSSAVQMTSTIQTILLKLERLELERVYLFYNRRGGAVGFYPKAFELLPIDLKRLQFQGKKTWPSRSLPTFTMVPQKLLTRLLRQYLFVSIFRACAESQSSEHATRLAAMQVAERNIERQSDEMNAHLRRVRQNNITSELLDIATGFEVATGSE